MGEVRSVRKVGIFVTSPFWFKTSVFECDCRKITSTFFVKNTHNYTTLRFLKVSCKSCASQNWIPGQSCTCT